MRVDLCRRQIGVSHHFLNRSDIGASREKVGGETMAKCVAPSSFVYTGPLQRLFHFLLDLSLADVMSTPNPRPWIGREPGGLENILPPRALGCLWVLCVQCIG